METSFNPSDYIYYPEPRLVPLASNFHLISSSAASKIAEEAFKSRAYYLKKIRGLERNLYNMRNDARRRQITIWKRNQQVKFLKSQLNKEKALRATASALSFLKVNEFIVFGLCCLLVGSLITIGIVNKIL